MQENFDLLDRNSFSNLQEDDQQIANSIEDQLKQTNQDALQIRLTDYPQRRGSSDHDYRQLYGSDLLDTQQNDISLRNSHFEIG